MPKVRDLESRLRTVAPQLFDSAEWLPLLSMLNKDQIASAVRRELFQVGELTHMAIATGHLVQAKNWVIFGLYVDQVLTREWLGAAGAFRPSKYQYRADNILWVLNAVEASAADLALNDSARAYLKSARAIAKLAGSVRKLDQSLRAFIRRNSDVVLKSVIARTDTFFMLGHKSDRTQDANLLAHYSAEELAEAASYIVHCINTEIGVREDHFNFMAEKRIIGGIFDKILVKACRIRAYCDAEILVDSFDYSCTFSGRVVTVTAPNPELEMSIRLGYMQNEQARDHIRLEREIARRDGVPSIFDVADNFFDRRHDRVVQRVDFPISRYTFRLPDLPPMRAMFSNEGATLEEQFYLREIMAAELVTWEEMRRFEVRPGLSVLDLSRVFRLFIFVSRLAMRQLQPLLDNDPEIALRSLVPVLKIDALKGLLRWCVSEEHVDAVLDFLCWTPDSPGLYDIQYRPIIRAGNHCMVPLHVAGMTNWYRNLAYLEKHRLIDAADQEAASRALSGILQEKCEFVRAEFETKLGGEHLEIDTVCRFGDYLFLFECKHSLLPCNVHELRTSYKHVQTGARQLSRAKELLSVPQHEAEYYRRLGWDVGPAKKIVTCIVSCNGMFSGLRIDGNPVRRFRELANMIETGIIRTANITASKADFGFDITADDWVERNLWGSDELTPEFLHDYLEGDRLSRMLFDSLIPHEERLAIDEFQLVFPTFALDLVNATKAISSLPDHSTHISEGRAAAGETDRQHEE
ncbi:hypothetical protein [Rhizobium etli]|uniref:hypothetical protein n=1 Tax=Rhizobium etli TaxID=29449 RepID=UPI000383A417|nr:hypothetical protein [Rhizobium etli]AGS25783.1 hypothetical protein REMIM1_PF00113 [Rhizobium etli bv. mimosae str. Mim1]